MLALVAVLAVFAGGLVPNGAAQVGGPLIGSEAGFSPGGEIFGFSDAELGGRWGGGGVLSQPVGRELDSMVTAGATYVRLDVPWVALEPSAPRLTAAGAEVRTFDWPRMDRLIDGARSRGLQVVALPAYTPAWARPARHQ